MNTYYQDLAKNFNTIQYLKKGEDDNGKPIYVVIYNPFPEKDLEKLRKIKPFSLSTTEFIPENRTELMPP
jgi:hypothetical protein